MLKRNSNNISNDSHRSILCFVLLSFVLLLVGCSQDSSEGLTVSNDKGAPLPLPAQLFSKQSVGIITEENLFVKVRVDGNALLPLQNQVIDIPNKTVTGQINGITAGPHTIQLVYFLSDSAAGANELLVAETSGKDVVVVADQIEPVNFADVSYSFPDTDGDHHSDLHEYLKGTAWDDINDFPVPEKPVITALVDDYNAAISWDDRGDASSYTLYFSEWPLDESNFNRPDQVEDLVIINNVSNPYVTTGQLNIDLNYNFVVTATNVKGVGDPSSAAIANPGKFIPKDFAITSINHGVKFEWPAGAMPEGATGYDLYMQTIPGLVKDGKGGVNGWMVHKNISNPFSHFGLTNGKPYYFALVAKSDAGDVSAFSTEVMATPQDTITGVPDGVSIKFSNNQTFLGWDKASIPDVSILKAYFSGVLGQLPSKNAPPNAGNLGDIDAQASSFQLATSLTPNYYVLTAFGSDSVESQESAVVGYFKKGKLSPPTITKIDELNKQLIIHWSSVPGANKYNLYMDIQANIDISTYGGALSNGKMIHSNVVNNFYDHPFATNGTPSFFVVTAINEFGESLPSAVVSGTPNASTPVNAPNVTGLSLQEALATVASSNLNAVLNVSQGVANPAVVVTSQTPAGGTGTTEKSTVTLNVSIPPDPNKFLTIPIDKSSDQRAVAYYAAVDPGGTRTTFFDWKNTVGLSFQGGQYELPDAEGLFLNKVDHGFVRVVSMKRVIGTDGGTDILFYANHYSTMDDALTGNNLKETVAIEFTPAPNALDPLNAPNDFGPRYAKFFAFDGQGNRVNSINLDGRGERFLPDVCMVCHAGTPLPVVQGNFLNQANVDSRLTPLDLDAFEFPETHPSFNRQAQEDSFKLLNQAVLDTYDDPIVANFGFDYVPPPGNTSPATDNTATIGDFCDPVLLTGAPRCTAGPGITDVALATFRKEGLIDKLTVNIHDLVHSNFAELQLQLISPAGVIVNLVANAGDISGTNMTNVVFDDQAPSTNIPAGGVVLQDNTSWRPAQPLSTLKGQDPIGRWTLRIIDNTASPGNAVLTEVRNWSIDFTLRAPVMELVEGWYGGKGLPNNFDGSYIPLGWQVPGLTTDGAGVVVDPPVLYSKVIKKSCRVCHLQRGYLGSKLDFATYADFTKQSLDRTGQLQVDQEWLNDIRHIVFVEGGMPRAKPTFENFWLSTNSYQPGVLASFLNDPALDGLTGPGRPVANAGWGDRVVKGTQVTLDGSSSIYTAGYAWSFVSVPTNPASAITNADLTPGPTTVSFTPDVAGTYVLQLITSNDAGSSAPSTVSVFVEDASFDPLLNPSFTEINKAIFQDDCIQCHRPGGPADHTGWIVDNDIATIYDMAANQARRIDLVNHGDSRLLTKPSGVEHGGGVRPGFDLGHQLPKASNTDADHERYTKLLNWITLGNATAVPPLN